MPGSWRSIRISAGRFASIAASAASASPRGVDLVAVRLHEVRDQLQVRRVVVDDQDALAHHALLGISARSCCDDGRRRVAVLRHHALRGLAQLFVLGRRQVLHRPDQHGRSHVRGHAAESIEKLDAVHPRHHQIEHDRRSAASCSAASSAGRAARARDRREPELASVASIRRSAPGSSSTTSTPPGLSGRRRHARARSGALLGSSGLRKHVVHGEAGDELRIRRPRSRRRPASRACRGSGAQRCEQVEARSCRAAARSSVTASNVRSRHRAIASAPVADGLDLVAGRRRASPTITVSVRASSSTTSTVRAPVARARSAFAQHASLAASTLRGSVAWNTLPLPGVERTPTVPPCASTSRRVSARPRPVP